MKKFWNRLKSNLRIEDYIAVVYVAVISSVYLYFFATSKKPHHGFAVTFYYFLMPFILVLFKEAFAYFLSDSPSEKRFIVILRDWFPFLIILSMYYSLYDVLSYFVSVPDVDAQLAAIDQAVFGCQPSVYMERFLNVPYLTDWLSFSYLSFVFMPPLMAFIFYIRGKYTAFRIVMLGFVITESLGCIGYVFFPAVGPCYAFREWYSVGLGGGAITYLNQKFINVARLPRDCVPSLHVALTALFYFAAWRWERVLFWIVTPLVLSLWLSCVFLRYHYAIDCIVGLALALAVHLALVRFAEPYFKAKKTSADASQ